MLAEGISSESSYNIWDSEKWYEEYGSLQLYWREVKVGKYYIILMCGNVHGDSKI